MLISVGLGEMWYVRVRLKLGIVRNYVEL